LLHAGNLKFPYVLCIIFCFQNSRCRSLPAVGSSRKPHCLHNSDVVTAPSKMASTNSSPRRSALSTSSAPAHARINRKFQCIELPGARVHTLGRHRSQPLDPGRKSLRWCRAGCWSRAPASRFRWFWSCSSDRAWQQGQQKQQQPQRLVFFFPFVVATMTRLSW